MIGVKGNILVHSTTLAVSATKQKLSVTNIPTNFTHNVLHNHKKIWCHHSSNLLTKNNTLINLAERRKQSR